jgi:DNA-binding GntR family transcriptional regulator
MTGIVLPRGWLEPGAVSDGELRLLAVLLLGGAARPSGATVTGAVLAAWTGVTVRQVQRRVRRLCDAGLLKVASRRGYRRPNVYRLAITARSEGT